MSQPSSLQRRVSPPPLKRKRTGEVTKEEEWKPASKVESSPTLAAIEAGEAVVEDHLDYFSKHLRKACRPVTASSPRFSITDFGDLYKRNQHDHGHHFVVHQHNHPIAGVHYDLRLQFSRTSTVSWAIPYGLPGNPNSKRQGRMAVETRVHNLWNNLIESASHATGSLLIWDTGEYSVLPRKKQPTQTDDNLTDGDGDDMAGYATNPDNEKLIIAFQGRYIRLRLHGTRLPPNYTIGLRLPSSNDRGKQQPPAPSYKRRRKSSWKPEAPSPASTSSDVDFETATEDHETYAVASASDKEEAALISQNNAYTGAENTIGSVHQRNWYLSLDRHNSGFVKEDGKWVRRPTRGDGEPGGFDAFFVLGSEVERSVVTGRLSKEIMEDEGIAGFRPRKMWRPVME